MTKLYVQYGSGFCAPAGWLNFDASPTLRFERLPVIGRIATKNAIRFPATCRYGDIVRVLPVAAGTADAVYASHVLEHLTFEDCRAALRNSLAILKPGGVFRLVVPDLQWRAADYVANVQAGAPDANAIFLRACGLGTEASPRSLWRAAIAVFGRARHLWMWDEPSMRRALTEAGFTHIRRAAFGDNPDPMFALVEAANRFEDHGRRELAIEAIKPNVWSKRFFFEKKTQQNQRFNIRDLSETAVAAAKAWMARSSRAMTIWSDGCKGINLEKPG